MRALVTGATGFVESRLVPALLKQGHEVVALVRDADSYAPPASVRVVEGLRNTVVVEDDRIHDHVSVDQTPFEAAVARAIGEPKRLERRVDGPETLQLGTASPAGSGDETPAGKQS